MWAAFRRSTRDSLPQPGVLRVYVPPGRPNPEFGVSGKVSTIPR